MSDLENYDSINDIESLYNNSVEDFKTGNYEQSENKLKYILELIPDNTDVLNFYGRLKQFQNKFDDSIDLLTKSVTIDNNNFMAHYNLALAYCIKKNLEKVKEHFNLYQKLNPDESPLKYFCNLYISKLHFDELDIEDTKEYYVKSKIPLFIKLSELLVPRIYNSIEHIENTRKEYLNSLHNIYNNITSDLIVSSEALFTEYLQFIYCYVFPLSYQGKNNAEILSLQCKLYRKLFPCLNYTSKYIDSIKTTNKIKIGFISTNFFNQSVSRDRMGIIRNLPRELFDVTVFFYFKPNDDLGNFIWDSDNTNIVLPDTTIFERRSIIEEQKLNILIYCDIGMAPDTYFLSFSRLAPIQCNTWGHSDTSGIDTIDYYLSSVYYEKSINPQENYTEKLVLLDSLCTFYYKIIENPTLVNKNYFGFSNNTNIYLSSQVLFKLNPDFDDVINNILINDQNGIIILIKMNLGLYIQDSLIERLEKKLKNNMTRVHLVEWQKCERDFYKLLSIADVIIDPYPFGGCNTSFSAFSMGIPIVTMPADFINGRFTYGLYKKMDILDLVAYNFQDYIKLANKCATDKSFRNNISEKIKNNLHLIFNEVESINSWINFCIDAVNNDLGTQNPIFITHKEKYSDTSNQLLNETSNQIVNKTSDLLDIPKIIHFIFFGYTEFTFIHYYSIKTANIHNPSYTIYLYNYIEPTNNLWWNLSKKYVQVILTTPPESIYNNSLNSYAHKADIIRLQKLIEYGGIYLDIDIWTNKSYDDLLQTNKSCIMGLQASNTQFEGLCNAVILSKPNSEFLKLWLEEYKSFDNTQWDYHSVHLPYKLSKIYDNLINIKPQQSFFPVSWWNFDDLFKKSTNTDILDNSYCLHLWESHLMDNFLEHINPMYFHIYDTPFSNIFKHNSNKSSILIIIEDTNYNFVNKAKLYIINLIYQEYNIYIDFTSNILENNSNNLFNINNDVDLLIDMLYKNKYNIDIIDNIITFVTPYMWIKIKQKLKKNITAYCEYNNDLNNYTSYFNYINDIIVPSNYDFSIFNNYIKTNIINYPINNINNTINYSKSDINLKNFLLSIFNCKDYGDYLEYNNMYFELHNTTIFDKLRKNNFIFYTFINSNDDLQNLIYIFNMFCNMNNYTNIILHITFTQFNIEDFKNKFNTIINNHPIIFNFITNYNINSYIHKNSNCYLSLNSTTNIEYIFSALYKKPIIICNNTFIDEYIPDSFFINYDSHTNNIDFNHIIHLMNTIYTNYNSETITNKINKNYVNISKFSYNNISLQLDKLFNKKSEVIQEVLVIGKINVFKERMDKLYYELLMYLKKKCNYKLIFVDSRQENNNNIKYFIDKYCSTNTPIIYNIVYIQEKEQIILDLHNTTLTKIYEIEDCYEVDMIINNINSFKYDYVIYRYNCEQMNYIISQTNTKFIHLPHYINNSLFTIVPNIKKEYDVFIYGNLSDFYPFRKRLFKLITNSSINYLHLPHPGYNEDTDNINNNIIIKQELSHIINKSKLTISTSSAFNYFIKKYLEISLSGSIICGNFPTTEKNPYEDYMCYVNETMSDEEILDKINNYINLPINEYNNIINNSYLITKNNFIYENANDKFNKIMEFIINENNQS